MRIPAIVLVALPLAGFALAATPACHHDDGTTTNPNTPTGPSAGPGEKAGEKVDEGAEKTKEKAKEATSAAGKEMEKGGEKMQGK